MTPEEAGLLEQGLRISAAHLRADEAEKDRLLGEATDSEQLPRLVEGFVYVAITAATMIGEAKGVPFQSALRGLEAQPDVILLPGLDVGPWDQIVDLAGAVKRSHDEARAVPGFNMDVPSAINASFGLAISALTALSKTPQLNGKSPADLAETFLEGIEQGYATS